VLLEQLLRGLHLSIVLKQTYEEDGAIVFREACKSVASIQTAWLISSLGTVSTLGEAQESEGAGCDARGGGGLGSSLESRRRPS